MNEWAAVITGLIVSAFGLATVAVIFSRGSDTSGVIQSGTSGLAAIIRAAVSPIGNSSGNSAGTIVNGGFGSNASNGGFTLT